MPTATLLRLLSLTVAVQLPVSAPPITVKVAAAPADAGVAVAVAVPFENSATNALAGGVCPAGFSVHVIVPVNVPLYPASETANVCDAPGAVASKSSDAGDAAGVGDGVGVGAVPE